jgi:hypothetical protein
MKQFIMAYWEIIIDVVVIVSCGITVLFFMKRKSKEDDLSCERKINFNYKKSQKKCTHISEGDVSNADRYGEVSRLSRLGLSIKEISKRLRIPQGEVELVITLRR